MYETSGRVLSGGKGSILVQVDEPEGGGTVRADRDEAIEKARETEEMNLWKKSLRHALPLHMSGRMVNTWSQAQRKEEKL